MSEPLSCEERGGFCAVRTLSERCQNTVRTLPTMTTTVGSGVTIGSPAISSAGGSRSGLEGPRAQGGDGAPTAAMRLRIKAAAWVLERGRLPSTGCDPSRLSTRPFVAALLLRCLAERVAPAPVASLSFSARPPLPPAPH